MIKAYIIYTTSSGRKYEAEECVMGHLSFEKK